MTSIELVKSLAADTLLIQLRINPYTGVHLMSWATIGSNECVVFVVYQKKERIVIIMAQPLPCQYIRVTYRGVRDRLLRQLQRWGSRHRDFMMDPSAGILQTLPSYQVDLVSSNHLSQSSVGANMSVWFHNFANHLFSHDVRR